MKFATKPQLARQLLERVLPAGTPTRWATADEAYGSDSQFRRFCEERGLGYVLAVSRQTPLFLVGRGRRVDQPLAELPRQAWQRQSCGAGAKGERWYDWAYVSWPPPEDEAFQRAGWCVARRALPPRWPIIS